MATETYEDLLKRAADLTPDGQLRLLESLAALVRQRIAPAQPHRQRPETPAIDRDEFEGSHNPMELRGLGTEIWREMILESS